LNPELVKEQWLKEVSSTYLWFGFIPLFLKQINVIFVILLNYIFVFKKVGAITQMINKLGPKKWSTLPKLYLDILESNAGKAMP
jgi:hypothetical protein